MADDTAHPGEDPHPTGPSHVRLALIVGLTVVLGFGGLAGWSGFRAYQSRQVAQQRELFLDVGRQGALNVTTLSYDHIEADMQRVLDSSTGQFYDDFQKRAPALIDAAKRVQSNSSGTVTAAAWESGTATQAEILVAVTVESAIAGQPNRDPQRWRMRILVQKMGDDAKMSNVEFV